MFNKIGSQAQAFSLIALISAGGVAEAINTANVASNNALSGVQADLLFLAQVAEQMSEIAPANTGVAVTTVNLCVDFTAGENDDATGYYDASGIQAVLVDQDPCTGGFIGSAADQKTQVYVNGLGFVIKIVDPAAGRLSEIMALANDISPKLAFATSASGAGTSTNATANSADVKDLVITIDASAT